MSYDPSTSYTATYGAYLATSSANLPTITTATGYYEFAFDQAVGACSIESNRVICEHPKSTATVDISTQSTAGLLNIFNYGFTNGTYRTASTIRNEYSKGDDAAWGMHDNNTVIQVDTGVFFRMAGNRNISGLDQLVGVIL